MKVFYFNLAAVTGVISFLIGVVLVQKERHIQKFVKFFGGLLIGFMYGTLVYFLTIMILMLPIGLGLPKQLSAPQEIQLASLRHANGLDGKFFLGCGTVKNTISYFYYEQNNNGGYIPRNLASEGNDIIIYEEKRSNGLLKIYSQEFRRPWLKFFAVITDKPRYQFHIPYGSLKKQFVLE